MNNQVTNEINKYSNVSPPNLSILFQQIVDFSITKDSTIGKLLVNTYEHVETRGKDSEDTSFFCSERKISNSLTMGKGSGENPYDK
jgi:hypothetical protein